MTAMGNAYLGRGVDAAMILRHAADQGRKHCAPVDMVERFDAAASVYAATGKLPDWAQPAKAEKSTAYALLREEDAE